MRTSKKFRLYYGVASNSTKDTLITVETSATSVQLKDLTPNTPYVIHMTAVGDKVLITINQMQIFG
jgi:hypothetical protein